MRRLGLGLALASLILLTQPQAGAAQETAQFDTYLTEVNSYIVFYHRHLGKWVKKRVARLQKNIAPAVVRQSIAQGLDPLLVSLLISCESTWRPGVTGKDGEVGIMQVMEPRFQPETLEDEILLGTEKRQMAMNACPGVLGALT